MGANSFLIEMTLIYMGGKRVASPERVPIYLKLSTFCTLTDDMDKQYYKLEMDGLC